jgi:6-phosphogluconolactonase
VRPDFRVLSYTIAADGQLSFCSSATLTGSPTHLACDPQGKQVFSASYSFNSVCVNPIGENGQLGEPLEEWANLSAPHSSNFIGADRVLVPSLKEDKIRIFTPASGGHWQEQVEQALATRPGAGPRHMAFHPTQAVAYCVNELDASVDVWAYDPKTWQCNHKQSISIMPAKHAGPAWAADIHVSSKGTFLYVSERTSSTLAVLQIVPEDQRLVLLGHHSTEKQPRGFALDHTGSYVLVAGQKSDHLAVYIITENGHLRLLKRYAVGKGPMWVSVLPKAD